MRLEVPEGRSTGRRFQMGRNKEVFDAEVFAVWQALRVLEQRNECDREYTIFMDSTSAITRIQDDVRGPGQRIGVAAIEVETRLPAAGNRVTIRGVPAHAGAEGNEVADRYVKDAATGRAPREKVPEGSSEEATHDEGRYRGQIQDYDRLDLGAHTTRTTLPTSSWEGR